MTRDEATRMLVRIKDQINFEWVDSQRKMDALNMAIEALERQRGEWSLNIDDWFGDCYKCSVCGEEFVLNEGTPKDNGYNYCPNCGAEMERRTDE